MNDQIGVRSEVTVKLIKAEDRQMKEPAGHKPAGSILLRFTQRLQELRGGDRRV